MITCSLCSYNYAKLPDDNLENSMALIKTQRYMHTLREWLRHEPNFHNDHWLNCP
jgi:hypothetical protein